MNTHIPFYVFSVSRSECSTAENAARTAFARAMLKREGLEVYDVQGRYCGTDEASFLIADTRADVRAIVQRISGLYDQESYLYVDANRCASLYNPAGGRLQDLGRWHEIPAEKARDLVAVTITPDGRYWSAAS